MNEFAKAKRGQRGRPFKFLDFKEGTGRVVPGETPDEQDQRIDEQLASPEMIEYIRLSKRDAIHSAV